ncbi:MAG TPA: hypothetical protein PLB81_02270, partial [Deltaproteobacteria bacterium]|nr:hypothetical protein [Deltaproteobacteria bacterium]
RRDVSLDAVDTHAGFVARLSDAQSKVCHAYFQAARADDEAKREAQAESMAGMLIDLLMSLSNREYRPGGLPHHPA